MMFKSYRPEIDGLRALAVFMVIFYHMDENMFPAGFLGVDIFFVISGYVITQTLFKDYVKSKKVNIINFYVRRIKRIYPLLIFVVVISLLIIAVFFVSNFQYYLKSGIFSILGLSNLYYLKIKQDYFLQETINPFLHTWSLGIEEQFYLIYPFILIFLFKISKKNNYSNAKLGSFFYLFSAILAGIFYLNQQNFFGHFFFPTARFWELSAGCGTFFLFNSGRKIFSEKFPFALLSILFILITFLLGGKIENIFFEILLIVISTVIIIFTIENSLLKLILSHKTTVYLGKISYGLYLWHYLVIYFLLNAFPKNIQYFISVIVISILLSSFTYFYVENPLRKNRYFDGSLKKIIKFFPVIVIILIFLVSFSKSRNLIIDSLNKIEVFAHKINLHKEKDILNYNSDYLKYSFINNHLQICQGDEYIDRDNVINAEHYLKNCLKKKNSKVLFHLIGDSMVSSHLPMIDSSKYDFDILLSSLAGGYYVPDLLRQNLNSTKSKEGTFDQQHILMNYKLHKDLLKDYEHVFIIISAKYSFYLQDRITTDLENIKINKNELYNVFEEKLEKFVNFFDKNVKIIFITETMEPKHMLINCLKIPRGLEKNCNLQSKNEIEKRRGKAVEIQNKIKNKHNNVYVLDLLPKICPENKCSFFLKERYAFIADGIHFTVETSKYMSRYFDVFLKENFSQVFK